MLPDANIAAHAWHSTANQCGNQIEGGPGATFELDMGGGIATVHDDGANDIRGGLVMPSIGLGGWLGERLAITGRIALMASGDTTWLGLDLRAGLNLRPEARHCLTLSVEVTPQNYGDHQAVGIALLAGYQYL